MRNQLENKGYEGFTLKEVISKIKKLRYKYKQEKDKTRRTGSGKAKKWKFFDDIDALLMTKQHVTAPCLVDTMTESKDQGAEDDSSATGVGNT